MEYNDISQIDIMPLTGGSGPEGTRELLSTGKPILAALNLTPVGRGILGALGTMALIPEESEAGIFTNVGKVSQLGRRIKGNGLSIFPEGTLVHEVPTSHWSGAVDADNMAQAIKNLETQPSDRMFSWKVKEAEKMTAEMKKAPLFKIDSKLAQEWDVADTTNALYGHRENAYPYGVVGVKDNLRMEEFLASLAHEYTHLGDEASEFTNEAFKALDKSKVPYEKRVTEVKAFTAGSRVNFPKELTDPASDYFVHPLISYTDGSFTNEPLVNYFNAMKAEKIDYNFNEILQYNEAMRDEIDKLNVLAKSDPVFKAKMDRAVEDIPIHYEAWVFNEGQQKARLETRKAARMKRLEAKWAAEEAAAKDNIKEYNEI